MKLYIANGTRQTYNFQYRLPGVPGLRSQYIPAGKQLLVNGDLGSEDIKYIVDTNAKYGLIDCTKIDQTKAYVGLCYSIDKPVPPPKLMKAFDHNLSVLNERGHHNREMAALTANQSLEDAVSQAQVGQLNGMDVEIIEEVKPGHATGRDAVSEGFRVSRTETKQARTTGREGKGSVSKPRRKRAGG